MARRKIWSIIGHSAFVTACLIVAAALGMAAAIGCGYGGNNCGASGIGVALASAAMLISVGYAARMIFLHVTARLSKLDKSGLN
jgi:hypothetical protein